MILLTPGKISAFLISIVAFESSDVAVISGTIFVPYSKSIS
nr:hypothetical protein [Clostridium perfringens]